MRNLFTFTIRWNSATGSEIKNYFRLRFRISEKFRTFQQPIQKFRLFQTFSDFFRLVQTFTEKFRKIQKNKKPFWNFSNGGWMSPCDAENQCLIRRKGWLLGAIHAPLDPCPQCLSFAELFLGLPDWTFSCTLSRSKNLWYRPRWHHYMDLFTGHSGRSLFGVLRRRCATLSPLRNNMSSVWWKTQNSVLSNVCETETVSEFFRIWFWNSAKFRTFQNPVQNFRTFQNVILNFGNFH